MKSGAWNCTFTNAGTTVEFYKVSTEADDALIPTLVECSGTLAPLTIIPNTVMSTETILALRTFNLYEVTYK